MKAFAEARDESFVKKDGYWSFEFGDGYELTIEPCLFDGQMYVALYQNQELMIEKLVVKEGK